VDGVETPRGAIENLFFKPLYVKLEKNSVSGSDQFIADESRRAI